MHICRLVAGLSVALILSSSLSAQAQGKKYFSQGQPFALEELPDGDLKTQIRRLNPEAKGEAMTRLQSFSFPASDAAKYLRSDNNGGIFIVCPINGCECDDPGHEHCNTASETQNAQGAAAAGAIAENMPIGDGSNDTFTPSASVAVSSPPAFNSKPGAPFHIYLDFNGASVTGKQWSYTDGTATWSSWD